MKMERESTARPRVATNARPKKFGISLDGDKM